MRTLIVGVLVAALAGLAGTGPGPSPAGAQGWLDSPWPEDWLGPGLRDEGRWLPRRMTPPQKQRMDRHRVFMQGRIIEPYHGMKNPLEPTQAVLVAGSAVYAEHCLRCHGPNGYGDGDAGNALDPSPAMLSFFIRMPEALDSYLMWTIAEGGAAFGSEMPAYKDVLTERQIWQVILFMRTGFGGSE